MLASGMNTFSEWLVDPRSECHSWSAYPSYYFLNTVAGIQPAAPGFEKVLVQPALGSLSSAQAAVPHPQGSINAVYQKQKNGSWEVVIDLPANVAGVLEWGGKKYALRGGRTKLRVPS
jgi:alpha-L-rhamnosidase